MALSTVIEPLGPVVVAPLISLVPAYDVPNRINAKKMVKIRSDIPFFLRLPKNCGPTLYPIVKINKENATV